MLNLLHTQNLCKYMLNLSLSLKDNSSKVELLLIIFLEKLDS
jgi:hypothetical protein